MSKYGPIENVAPRSEEQAPSPWTGSRSVDWEKMRDAQWATRDGDKVRIIEGIATTVRANEHGYAVAPLGAKFTLPLSLVLGHETKRRIGWVVDAQVDPFNIRFTAELARFDVYPEVETAWRAIVTGTLRGVSAGFPPGGIGDFRNYRADVDRVAHAWTWSELTVCKVGANPDAKILTVKTWDQGAAREYVHVKQITKSVRYG
jgi:hypothetical protein